MPKPGFYYYENRRAMTGIFFLVIISLGASFSNYESPSVDIALEWFRAYRVVMVVIISIVTAILVVVRQVSSARKRRRFSREDSYEGERFAHSDDRGADHRYQSPVEFVLSLEEYRKHCGYKPGWLFYRCLELNLAETLEDLRRSGQVESPWESNKESRGGSYGRTEETRAEKGVPKDPYEILGVSKTATTEEIRKAYYELVKLYHPDRVHGLGRELQDLAKEMTTAINGAYEALMNKN